MTMIKQDLFGHRTINTADRQRASYYTIRAQYESPSQSQAMLPYQSHLMLAS